MLSLCGLTGFCLRCLSLRYIVVQLWTRETSFPLKIVLKLLLKSLFLPLAFIRAANSKNFGRVINFSVFDKSLGLNTIKRQNFISKEANI